MVSIKRPLLSGVAAGLAFGVLAVAAPANAATTGKPAVVLEHGAFADASSWNGVIEELRKDGYPVVAAANPLRGPAEDAAAPRSVLDHVEGPTILVGHSYGGSVMSVAGANDPRSRRWCTWPPSCPPQVRPP
ncbi:esterase/lipase family protein [Nonomuraea sp. NPDC050451]|uniref:esterase/lipase family protein n=1 Tax=Nonomuraea sp. NPDC050451 TaxID=3364364 RepID=UPI0037BAA901